MRKIAALALAAAALSVAAPSASAANCYGLVAGSQRAQLCNERVWERQRWYADCQLDGAAGAVERYCALVDFWYWG
ncbi:MAG TPA: hypothetical protein VNA20_18535 [Frankiaceae bacterium]|nr:hypothetical protein [Frankiaceae bacterium]